MDLLQCCIYTITYNLAHVLNRRLKRGNNNSNNEMVHINIYSPIALCRHSAITVQPYSALCRKIGMCEREPSGVMDHMTVPVSSLSKRIDKTELTRVLSI